MRERKNKRERGVHKFWVLRTVVTLTPNSRLYQTWFKPVQDKVTKRLLVESWLMNRDQYFCAVINQLFGFLLSVKYARTPRTVTIYILLAYSYIYVLKILFWQIVFIMDSNKKRKKRRRRKRIGNNKRNTQFQYNII